MVVGESVVVVRGVGVSAAASAAAVAMQTVAMEICSGLGGLDCSRGGWPRPEGKL